MKKWCRLVVFHGYLLGSSQREPVRRAVMSIVLSASRLRAGVDADGPDARFGLRPHEVDRQQAVVEPRPGHLDAVGQHESALELTGGDAAMQVDAVGVVGLLAPHRQLVLDQLDGEVVGREAGHGQGDAQAVLADPLDIVGRVALGVLRQPFERALELVESPAVVAN